MYDCTFTCASAYSFCVTCSHTCRPMKDSNSPIPTTTAILMVSGAIRMMKFRAPSTASTCTAKNVAHLLNSSRVLHAHHHMVVTEVFKSSRIQEAAGSITFVQIPIKNYIFEILTLRAFDSYMNGSNRRGGDWGGSECFRPPLQKFTGPLLRNFKYIIGILSKPSRLAPFLSKLG